MKRRHSMPFGAELTGNGTRFRLWAPAAARVDVELDAAGRRDRRTLQALEGGWFELFVEGIGAGVRYAYRIDGGQQIPIRHRAAIPTTYITRAWLSILGVRLD